MKKGKKETLILSAYRIIKVRINQDFIVIDPIDPNQKEYMSTSEDDVPGGASSEIATVVNHGPMSVAEYRTEYALEENGGYTDDIDKTTHNLLGVYNHAPLGWTKICDRNLDIGSVIYDGEGVLRTANVDLEGTPPFTALKINRSDGPFYFYPLWPVK